MTCCNSLEEQVAPANTLFPEALCIVSSGAMT
jgi:hypothetical protein